MIRREDLRRHIKIVHFFVKTRNCKLKNVNRDMSLLKRGNIHAGIVVLAYLLVCAGAQPIGNDDASLKIAERLINEALKKEIHDELNDAMTQSRKEKETHESKDAGAFEEFLEAAFKGTEAGSESMKRIVEPKEKAGASVVGSEGVKDENRPTSSRLVQKPKANSQSSSGMSESGLLPQDNEILLNALGIQPKNDVTQQQVYQADLNSLKKSKSIARPRSKGKQQQQQQKVTDGNIAATASETQKANESKNDDWQEMRDEEIASKINEFYKILKQYSDENPEAKSVDKSYGDQHVGLATRQQALPLDQPIRMRLKGSIPQEKKSWLQKKEDNAKLIAELEKLAASLKKGSQDTPNDVFPSIGKMFRMQQRSISGGHELPMNANRMPYGGVHSYKQAERGTDDNAVFRREDFDYPWSKYFSRGKLQPKSTSLSLSFLPEERDTGKVQEEQFMDEIEARVAELQKQLKEKKYERRSAKTDTLRM